MSTYGDEEDVIDVRTDVVVKTLHFPEGTVTPQYDSAGRKVFVNLHGADDVIAEIDHLRHSGRRPAAFPQARRFPGGTESSQPRGRRRDASVYAPEQEEGGRPVSRMIVCEAIARP